MQFSQTCLPSRRHQLSAYTIPPIVRYSVYDPTIHSDLDCGTKHEYYQAICFDPDAPAGRASADQQSLGGSARHGRISMPKPHLASHEPDAQAWRGMEELRECWQVEELGNSAHHRVIEQQAFEKDFARASCSADDRAANQDTGDATAFGCS